MKFFNDNSYDGSEKLESLSYELSNIKKKFTVNVRRRSIFRNVKIILFHYLSTEITRYIYTLILTSTAELGNSTSCHIISS